MKYYERLTEIDQKIAKLKKLFEGLVRGHSYVSGYGLYFSHHAYVSARIENRSNIFNSDDTIEYKVIARVILNQIKTEIKSLEKEKKSIITNPLRRFFLFLFSS